MRVVIADDNALMREGIAGFLRRAGFEVVAQASSADELLRDVEAHEPDVAIVDIRMPPTFTDEGLRAAHEIRKRFPAIGIVDPLPARRDRDRHAAARGEPATGSATSSRIASATSTSSPARCGAWPRAAPRSTREVVSRLLASRDDDGALASLSAREREVLALVAEGRSNRAIGDRLELSQRGVQKHVTAVFAKLGLTADEDDNRRILAVLEYLRLGPPQAAAGG